MVFMDVNRKNCLVCFLKEIVDEKAACKPLKSWEKVRNAKQCPETMKYSQTLFVTLECVLG